MTVDVSLALMKSEKGGASAHAYLMDCPCKLWRDFFTAIAENWKNLKDTTLFFHRFLCVRIEIDQLYCVNF